MFRFFFGCSLAILFFCPNAFAQTDALMVDNTGKVGIGTNSPVEKLSVSEGAIDVRATNGASVSIVKVRNTGLEFDRPAGSWGYISALNNTSGLFLATGGKNRIKIAKEGYVQILDQAATGGDNYACFSTTGWLRQCGDSSLLLKTNIKNYDKGLSELKKLTAITYDWKDKKNGTARDVGFAAEEMAKVEPLFATYHKDGSVKGIHYPKLVVLLSNAIKEQQAQIEQQGKQIKELEMLVRSSLEKK